MVIKKSPEAGNGLITFGEALKKLTLGSKVMRAGWPDNGEYLIIADERLMIYKPDDDMLHPLIVTTGDIVAHDWQVTFVDN